MTREQAINYLYSSGFSEGQVQAVVEALTDEDAISRAEAIDQMEQSYNILDAVDRVMALPSVQAVCEDAISREDAIAKITRFSTEEGASVECQQLYCDVNNMPSVTQKGDVKNV